MYPGKEGAAPRQGAFRRTVFALLVGALGGALFDAARAPLPWMLGPIFAIAACNLAGAGLAVPIAVRRGGQWVVGAVLGLYFTPEAVSRMVSLGPALAIATLVALALGLCFCWALIRYAGADGATAFFGGAIGGASEMLVQGERNGGSGQLISAGHTLRLIIVISLIPFGMAALGIHGDDAWLPPPVRFDLPGLILLVLTTGVAGWVALRFGVPNAWVLGPLLVAAGLAYLEAPVSSLPRAVINGGQLLLGVAIGSRFAPDFFRVAPRYLSVIAFSSLAGVLMAWALAACLARLSGLPIPTLLLAVAPGGVAEMALTAKVLQLGVPIVTAFQVTRIVVLLLSVGTLYRLLARRYGWPAGKPL
jgi:membrane AbrB-like protein